MNGAHQWAGVEGKKRRFFAHHPQTCPKEPWLFGDPKTFGAPFAQNDTIDFFREEGDGAQTDTPVVSAHEWPSPNLNRNPDSVAGAGALVVGTGGAGADLDGRAEGLDAGDVSGSGFGRSDGDLCGGDSAVSDIA